MTGNESGNIYRTIEYCEGLADASIYGSVAIKLIYVIEVSQWVRRLM